MADEAKSWTNTGAVILLGVGVGIALLVTLTPAKACPRLKTQYQKAIQSPARGSHDMAQAILGEARASECRWVEAVAPARRR